MKLIHTQIQKNPQENSVWQGGIYLRPGWYWKPQRNMLGKRKPLKKHLG